MSSLSTSHRLAAKSAVKFFVASARRSSEQLQSILHKIRGHEDLQKIIFINAAEEWDLHPADLSDIC